MARLHSGPLSPYCDVCAIRVSAVLLSPGIGASGNRAGSWRLEAKGGIMSQGHAGQQQASSSPTISLKVKPILSQLEEAQQPFPGIVIVSKAYFVRKEAREKA